MGFLTAGENNLKAADGKSYTFSNDYKLEYDNDGKVIYGWIDGVASNLTLNIQDVSRPISWCLFRSKGNTAIFDEIYFSKDNNEVIKLNAINGKSYVFSAARPIIFDQESGLAKGGYLDPKTGSNFPLSIQGKNVAASGEYCGIALDKKNYQVSKITHLVLSQVTYFNAADGNDYPFSIIELYEQGTIVKGWILYTGEKQFTYQDKTFGAEVLFEFKEKSKRPLIIYPHQDVILQTASGQTRSFPANREVYLNAEGRID
jgi:hypothetical protein